MGVVWAGCFPSNSDLLRQRSIRSGRCRNARDEKVRFTAHTHSQKHEQTCLEKKKMEQTYVQTRPTSSTYLSILMAQRLRIDAVHRSTSNEIHISHRIHPSCQEPVKKKRNRTEMNKNVEQNGGQEKQVKNVHWSPCWTTECGTIAGEVALMATANGWHVSLGTGGGQGSACLANATSRHKRQLGRGTRNVCLLKVISPIMS